MANGTPSEPFLFPRPLAGWLDQYIVRKSRLGGSLSVWCFSSWFNLPLLSLLLLVETETALTRKKKKTRAVSRDPRQQPWHDWTCDGKE